MSSDLSSTLTTRYVLSHDISCEISILTFIQIAELFSEVLGRKITHKKLSVAEFEQTFVTFGVSLEHSRLLASMEEAVSNGIEEGLFNSPAEKKYIGKHKLSDYIRENKALWITE